MRYWGCQKSKQAPLASRCTKEAARTWQTSLVATPTHLHLVHLHLAARLRRTPRPAPPYGMLATLQSWARHAHWAAVRRARPSWCDCVPSSTRSTQYIQMALGNATRLHAAGSCGWTRSRNALAGVEARICPQDSLPHCSGRWPGGCSVQCALAQRRCRCHTSESRDPAQRTFPIPGVWTAMPA